MTHYDPIPQAPYTNGDLDNTSLPVKNTAELRKNPDGSPQELILDLHSSLQDADPTSELRDIGVNGELLAKIESVGEQFYIVRLRQNDFDAQKNGYEIFSTYNTRVSGKSPKILTTEGDIDPLVLVHFHDMGEDKPALTARGINEGVPLHIGANVPVEVDPKAGRFDFSHNPHMSRQHLSLFREGNDTIRLNVTSTNNTRVSYGQQAEFGDNPLEGDTIPRAEMLANLAQAGLRPTVEVGPADAEKSALDKHLEKFPILRPYQEQMRRIARMRAREEAEGPRYGMQQFVSSELAIDELVDQMNRAQRPTNMSEDRRGAVYRYMDMING